MIALSSGGHYKSFAKFCSIWFMVSFLLSGSLIPISGVPAGCRWLFYCSPAFWTISGTILAQMRVSQELEEMPPLLGGGEKQCVDLMTCMLYGSRSLVEGDSESHTDRGVDLIPGATGSHGSAMAALIDVGGQYTSEWKSFVVMVGICVGFELLEYGVMWARRRRGQDHSADTE